MRKTINIPSKIIDYANSKNIDEGLRILGAFVRYKLTGKIEEGDELLKLMDSNQSRSEKMRGNKNSVKQTKKQSETDKKTEGNRQQKQSETDEKNSVKQICFSLKTLNENWLNQTHEESGGFIYTNSILYNIVNNYIDNNIGYSSIKYQINKQGREKYVEAQVIEAEKLIKKIGFQTFQTILNYIPNDEFRSKNILSIAKLNKKNKEGIPYYVIIMDRIKQYKPKVIYIPTV